MVLEYLKFYSSQQHAFRAPIVADKDDGRPRARPREEEREGEDLQEPRHPYANIICAGGLGGLTGDLLMHSLDTVKTRQQGDPHRPTRFPHLISSYVTIFHQEGLFRGLYGGVIPAALGSISGTALFFGSYEWSKRLMIDNGMAPSLAYINAGLFADIVASPVYVPSEVLKTRLQLQGRYNNPHFKSGYNYRSLWDATTKIARTEGISAFYYGYRATLCRDLPFSALQFTFYEKEREWAKLYVGSPNIGLSLEVITGAIAGGLAGTLTCPLDVVKTRIQTQVARGLGHSGAAASRAPPSAAVSTQQTRQISTSSASTSILKPGSITLDTSSVLTGLKLIYKTEGLAGWFRGVGPRAVWTSVQSSAMFLLYQRILLWLSESSAPAA